MENLTLRNKIEIVRLVGDNVRSTREAAREFNNRHPDRRVSRSTVQHINKVFNETGSVSKNLLRTRHNGRRGIYNNNDQILEYFNDNPRASIRTASLNLNIPRESIRRCLAKNKVKAFKPKILHTLELGDEERRLEFCYWLQGEYLNTPNFLNDILFSDEATLTTNGVVSSQNCRHWSAENPEFIINAKRQYSQKINVWCGILNDRIIGPFFFERNLNANGFLNFLGNEFQNALDDLPLQNLLNLKFQLDGSPIHNAFLVREWLNEHFENRWIGRNSPLIEWPPRSPDLTPLDFFLWGLLKQKVYKTRPQTVPELRVRILQACAEITPEQLRKVTMNVRKRIDKCIEINGGLVEATKI